MRRREVFRIRGLVQGVGFRPTVWHTARRLHLAGAVCNDAQGVLVDVEGEAAAVLAFAAALRRDIAENAPLARIDEVTSLGLRPLTHQTDFVITPSRQGPARTMVTPDAATCPDCTREIFDIHNRRYRYAFTNCTHCGPRFTITRHIPYDRAQTSMASFPMCPDCRAEYEDPSNRRFHAQPNACPKCGPQLRLTDEAGRPMDGDPIARTQSLLRAGKIVAVKGLGGFHLACDARSEAAVLRLRQRKGRSEKALAVMVGNVSSAQRLGRFSEAGLAALAGVARPIVLVEKTADCDRLVAPSVAPLYAEIGLMLPYTPVHLLLFFEAAGRPAEGLPEAPQDLMLVMTSANPSGEPLVTENDEALKRLAGVADAFLLHDRAIVARCDDSVVRDMAGTVRCVRRARGLTPLPLPIAAGPCLLARGPHQKTTACITRGTEAFLTEHIGDTDNVAACEALEHSVAHFLDILEVRPEAVVCDAHPDFPSTRLAEKTARRHHLPLVRVQHHHAHVAAVAGEWSLSGPVWGLAMDGTGWGEDGTAWGGELLLVKPDGTFERRGHLTARPLPGGDRAAREPWRMGAVMCLAAHRPDAVERFWPDKSRLPILELITRPRLCVRTSSLGRLFDAASAVCGLTEVVQDEAYAAVRLESAGCGRTGRRLENAWRIEDGVLDFAPLFAQLIDRRLGRAWDPRQSAADFEATVAAGLLAWAAQCMNRSTLPVCLAGGAWLNRTLSRCVVEGFKAQGRRAYLPEKLPPGDGAVSYGEALVARARLSRGSLEK